MVENVNNAEDRLRLILSHITTYNLRRWITKRLDDSYYVDFIIELISKYKDPSNKHLLNICLPYLYEILESGNYYNMETTKNNTKKILNVSSAKNKICKLFVHLLDFFDQQKNDDFIKFEELLKKNKLYCHLFTFFLTKKNQEKSMLYFQEYTDFIKTYRGQLLDFVTLYNIDNDTMTQFIQLCCGNSDLRKIIDNYVKDKNLKLPIEPFLKCFGALYVYKKSSFFDGNELRNSIIFLQQLKSESEKEYQNFLLSHFFLPCDTYDKKTTKDVLIYLLNNDKEWILEIFKKNILSKDQKNQFLDNLLSHELYTEAQEFIQTFDCPDIICIEQFLNKKANSEEINNIYRLFKGIFDKNTHIAINIFLGTRHNILSNDTVISIDQNTLSKIKWELVNEKNYHEFIKFFFQNISDEIKIASFGKIITYTDLSVDMLFNVYDLLSLEKCDLLIQNFINLINHSTTFILIEKLLTILNIMNERYFQDNENFDRSFLINLLKKYINRNQNLENLLLFLRNQNFFWQEEYVDDFYGKNLNILESNNKIIILNSVRSYGLYTKKENILERWKDKEKHVEFAPFLIDYFKEHAITDFKKWSMCFENISDYSTTHISLLKNCVDQIQEKKLFLNQNHLSQMHGFFQFLTSKIKNEDVLSIIENGDDPKIKGCSSWNLFAGYWFSSIAEKLAFTNPENKILLFQQKKYLQCFLTEVKDINWFVKKNQKTGWFDLWLNRDPLSEGSFGQFFDNERKNSIGNGELWDTILHYPQLSKEFKTTIQSVMNNSTI